MISSVCDRVRRLHLAMACILLSVSLPGQAAATTVGGTVRDSSGRILEQVGIFLLGESVGDPPISRHLSDTEGRFDLGELAPGSYRLAAVKEGYRLYLGRVDTLVQRSIQIILQPMPETGEKGSELVTGSASWSLRLPRRSLLRETGAEALVRRSSEQVPLVAKHSGTGNLLSGEFLHSFEARSAPGGGDRLVDAYGLNTTLNMNASVNERTRVAFTGNRRSVDRTAAGSDVAAATRVHVNAGLSYDAGGDDRVGIRTSFNGMEPEQTGGVPAAFGWSCDARWSRQLDGASRLGVYAGYRGGSGQESTVALSDAVAGKWMILAGDYEAMAAPGHRVTAAMEATRLQGAETGPDPAAWTIRVRSEDAWTVAGPVTLVYGVEYRRQHGYGATGVLRPKLGASWAGPALAMRWEAVGTMIGGSAGGPVGYEAEMEIPLPGGFRLSGEVTRDPLADRLPEDAPAVPGLLVRSYGAVNFGGRSMTLARTGASGRFALTWSDGDLLGLLGTAPDLESPILLWDETTLRFVNLDLALVFPSTGTVLAVGVRETRTSPVEARPGPKRRHNRYSIHLTQDLAHPSRGAAWRLAVALIAQDQASEQVSRYSMLNAGVSVVF